MNLRCITLLLLTAVALQCIVAKNLHKHSESSIQNDSNEGRFLAGIINKFSGGKGGNKQKGNNVPITIITSSELPASAISSSGPYLPTTSTFPCCKPTRPRPYPLIPLPSTVTWTFDPVASEINTGTEALPSLISSPSDQQAINPVALTQSVTGSGVLQPISSGPVRSLKEDEEDETEVKKSELLNNFDDSSINFHVNAEYDELDADDKIEELNQIEERRGNASIRRKQLMRRHRTQTSQPPPSVKEYVNKLKHRNIALQFESEKPWQNSNVSGHDQQWLLEMRWRRHQQLLRRKRQMLMKQSGRHMKQKSRLVMMKKRRR